MRHVQVIYSGDVDAVSKQKENVIFICNHQSSGEILMWYSVVFGIWLHFEVPIAIQFLMVQIVSDDCTTCSFLLTHILSCML